MLAQTGGGLHALRLQPMQRGWAASPVESCANLADEDGALKNFRAACAGGDLALALRTSSALVKIVTLPAAAKESLASAAELQMDRLSPFGTGEQTIGHEILAEENGALTVLVASAPDTLFETWDALLPRLHAELPGRVDLAILGAWHMLRTRHAEAMGAAGVRKLALVEIDGEWNIVLAEAGVPRWIRGITPATENEWKRDLRLSLLSAESEIGPGKLDEVLVFSNVPGPSDQLLTTLCGCGARRFTNNSVANALEGCAHRCLEKKSINLLPAAWVARRKARVVSRNFNTGVAAAAALWLALVAVLFGGPSVTRFFLDLDKDQIKALHDAFQNVDNYRQRVNLIGRYMDRSKSALEALRVIVESMPPSVTLTSVSYIIADGAMKVDGESTHRDSIYVFKETLQQSPPFVECDFIGAISAVPGRGDRFSLDVRFVKKEAPKK